MPIYFWGRRKKIGMKKYKLEGIVFLSGAIQMGLELLASRILSPYVGSSNVVWTSIIGIILISMSLGYWYGGKKADKNSSLDVIAEVLLIAALAASFIPIFETLIVKNIAGIISNLTLAAIICALIVFSVPSFILAMISPLAVKLTVKNNLEIGSSSGRISAISTIGSIVGTFLMGFVLIPHIGASNINICIILILLVMSIIIRENRDKKYFYLTTFCVSLAIMLVVLGKYVFLKSNPDIVLDTDSEYSRIWVKEIQTQQTSYKTLQVDMGLESYLDTQTNEMGAEYLKYYDLFEYFNREAKSTLLIGGAAYTYPMHYLNKYQDKTIDVVEIDDKMTQIAKEQFGLNTEDPRLTIYSQDGRSFLNYSENQYDTILIDAFKGLNAPFELTTYEAMVNAKKRLKENGIVITNVISAIEGKDSDFIKYEYATYKAVFDDVKIFAVKDYKEKEESQNLILIGIKGNPQIDENKHDEYVELLEKEILDFTTDKNIVTDDFAVIGN